MMVRLLEKRQQDYYYNVAVPILTERFESVNVLPYGIGEMIPHNLEELKTDKIYQNVLKTTSYMRGVEIYFQEVLLSKMTKAKNAIETEMDLIQ